VILAKRATGREQNFRVRRRDPSWPGLRKRLRDGSGRPHAACAPVWVSRRFRASSCVPTWSGPLTHLDAERIAREAGEANAELQ
jgi:hypothetical protein